MTGLESAPEWLFGYAVVFTLVHLVIAYAFYRWADRITESVDPDAAPAERAVEADQEIPTKAAANGIERDESVVACDSCGVENELGYRYCRHCVTELPVTVDRRRPGSTPGRRGIL